MATTFNLRKARIRVRFFAFLLLIAAGIIAYHFYASHGKQSPPSDVAYILPSSLTVVDTPAEIRLAVEAVKAGDQVKVLLRTRNWSKIELASGRSGWVESKDLLSAQTYEASQKLLKDLENLPAQAQGHAPDTVNLRFEPSRESVTLAQLPRNQALEVFQRKIVERTPQLDQTSAAGGGVPPKAGVHAGSSLVKEAWYLVRAGPRAGWVLGRFVSLDIPEALSAYAQGSNMVAWRVLNTKLDGGHAVPQYVVADRNGNTAVDFNHVRVFTWWVKNQRYVTAYIEGGLEGFFPIRTMQVGSVPYFRLNLIDSDGGKIQKVYGLFDTITRPVGIVDGWDSDAMPVRPPAPRGRRRRC